MGLLGFDFNKLWWSGHFSCGFTGVGSLGWFWWQRAVVFGALGRRLFQVASCG